MSASEAAEHSWLGGPAEAEVTRANASTVLEAHEQEAKAEKAKIMAGRRSRFRVRPVVVERRVVTAAEEGTGTERDANVDAGEGEGEEEGGCGKRRA